MNWSALEKEFDAWRSLGLTLPFWWRDDDAVSNTPQLQDLLDLSVALDVPVHLAVIPANLKDDLVEFVAETTSLIPVTHGFEHINHAPAGQKKCEYPNGRAPKDVRTELQMGYKTLSSVFGASFAPIFVPPWNRFDNAFKADLEDIGYKWFSTFTPRQNRMAFGGVEQINTHIDPIDWHGSRSAASTGALLDQTLRVLQDRRLGVTDNDEPFGFLTHHLVHDPEIWAFSKRFLQAFAAGPTRVWTANDIEKGH